MVQRIVMGIVLLVAASACATDNPRLRAGFHAPEAPARILVMAPRVELGLLTAAGMVEPRADWTLAAETHLSGALEAELAERGHLALAAGDAARTGPRELQLIGLHEAVAASALAHGPGDPVMALPTKARGFDWTLGEGARELAAVYGADLGLFVFVTGSYASSGRIATSVVAGALLGVAPPLGTRQTLASLVDLHTGDIVWMGTVSGYDPREADGARSLIDRLTRDAPL